MDDIQGLDDATKDYVFGIDELEIVQESYTAILASTNLLKRSSFVSMEAIQLHRIHVQSLADRLGVQMSTVAVEQFSSRTMHAFALEESEGFFAKIGKAIAAIFKWIRDKISAFFKWLGSLFNHDKIQKNAETVKEACKSLRSIDIRNEGTNYKVTVSVNNADGTENKKELSVPTIKNSFRQMVEDPAERLSVPPKLMDFFLDLADLRVKASRKRSEFITKAKSVSEQDFYKELNDLYKSLIEPVCSKYGVPIGKGKSSLTKHYDVFFQMPTDEELSAGDFSNFKLVVESNTEHDKLKQPTDNFKIEKSDAETFSREQIAHTTKYLTLLKSGKKAEEICNNALKNYDKDIADLEKRAKENNNENSKYDRLMAKMYVLEKSLTSGEARLIKCFMDITTTLARDLALLAHFCNVAVSQKASSRKNPRQTVNKDKK